MTPATSGRPDPTGSASQGFLPIALPLVLTALALLALTLASIWLLSSLRAYAHGEGLFSKAEHRATVALMRYVASGQEADYQEALRDFGIIDLARAAREGLLRPGSDAAAAAHYLVLAGNHAADAPNMVRLFRLAHALPQMTRAVELWGQGDADVVRLEQVAGQLHGLIAGGHPDPQQLAGLLERARVLHAHVVPLEQDFADTVNDVSRQTAWLLAVAVTLSAALLVAASLLVTRAGLRRSERIAAEYAARLAHQATHDALTGLCNRREFEVRLRAAIELRRSAGTGFALMYFDLDQIKVVNDTCGHAAGDELIRRVAWLARARLPDPTDVLARLGGDEFGVLVRDCPVEQAQQLAEWIRADVAGQRFHWQERTFVVSASIGVACLDDTLFNVEEALSAVDRACYVAKSNGRNRVHLYRPDDQQVQAMRGEMDWVERLYTALDGDGFLLLAQEIRPIGAHAGQGALVPPPRRFELLLRLIDVNGQPLAPMGFIPAAERYGLMPRIDRWVIARACRELGEIRACGVELPTCMINLSATSVSDTGLADHIAGCLEAHGLEGRCLGFELTETAAISNLGQAAQLFARLREQGCLIALDDFGSGMASFAYLKTLPIDFVKIDGGFIRNIRNDPVDFALVEAVQRISDVLGFQTVAEWVETPQVLDALAHIGVDFAQGFYLHRPEPLAVAMAPERAPGA